MRTIDSAFAILMIVAMMLCVDWTRFKGTVKAVNLKDNTVTILNRDGDLLTIPVDYQVTILDKSGDTRALKDLQLDQKITLTRTAKLAPPPEDNGDVPEWKKK